MKPPRKKLRWWHGVVVVVAHLALVAVGATYGFAQYGESFSSIKWTWWWFAWLAVPLGATITWLMILLGDRMTPRLRIATVAPLVTGPRGRRARIRHVPAVFRGVALTLGLLALSRPEMQVAEEQTTDRGIDIVIVLDLSGSMRAVMDGPTPLGHNAVQKKRPTRLDTAKDVILDFIGRRKTDRIGVVVFGRAAYVLSPPTLDYTLLNALVQKMDLDLIDSNGTAIGDAVGTGVARLRRSNAKSKAIILLTDGDSNAGEIAPEYAAHLAQKEGVHVYTVPIGNGDDAEMEQGVDIFGQPRYVHARFPVNPELLKKIATDTGGESFVATDRNDLEQSMHKILDSLEKSKIVGQSGTVLELFPVLMWPAVIFLLLEVLLRVFVLRRFP
ncbi:VWA domain-containing protein [soil metagenome]